jgi:glycosidase
MEEARCQIQLKARDNARTPMQWTPNANGGFTTASKPWMRVNDDFETCNALLQVADANSVYNHWASVLQLRKRYKKVFVYGSFELVDPGNETLFVYERAYNGSCALILLNWSSIEYQWEVDSKRKVLFHKGRIIQSNYGRSKVVLKDELLLVLQPWEALVLFHEA